MQCAWTNICMFCLSFYPLSCLVRRQNHPLTNRGCDFPLFGHSEVTFPGDCQLVNRGPPLCDVSLLGSLPPVTQAGNNRALWPSLHRALKLARTGSHPLQAQNVSLVQRNFLLSSIGGIINRNILWSGVTWSVCHKCLCTRSKSLFAVCLWKNTEENTFAVFKFFLDDLFWVLAHILKQEIKQASRAVLVKPTSPPVWYRVT